MSQFEQGGTFSPTELIRQPVSEIGNSHNPELPVFETNNFVLLTGRANPELAIEVAGILGKQVSHPVTLFADRETRVQIPDNLRKRDVYIIQPTSQPVNDHVMELIFMCDAARRGSAGDITAVMPYFGYSRQDRKEQPRVSIASAVVARMIKEAGANKFMTFDLHAGQEQGFIQEPWDDLGAEFLIVPELIKRGLTNLVVAAPDEGGVKRALRYNEYLSPDGFTIVYKNRNVAKSDSSEALTMTGDVEGKQVLLVDDIIGTASTMAHAASMLKDRGATRVMTVATHGVFSGNALETIEKSAIDEVIVTNTIAQPDEIRSHPKISIVSIAPMIAEAIRCNQTGESISENLFIHNPS